MNRAFRLSSRLTSLLGRNLATVVAVVSISAGPLACGGGDKATDSDSDDSELAPDGGVVDDGDEVLDLHCSLRTGVAALPVLLSDSNGEVLAVEQTNASGVANFQSCPSGAMLSFASLDEYDGWRGVTLGGVEPGQDYEIALPRLGEVGTAEVQVPSDGADIEFIQVSAGSSCYKASSEGVTASVAITADCLSDDGSLPVLAYGRIGSIRMFSYSDSASMVGDSVQVSDMSTWMTGLSIGLSVSNAPAGNVQFSTESLRDGARYFNTYQFATVQQDGTAAATLPLAPSGFSNSRRVGVVKSAGFSSRGFVREAGLQPVDFDFGSLPPELTSTAVDNGVADRPEFSIEGTPENADFVILRALWIANDEEVDWRIIMPATAPSFQFPALPPELAAATPNGTTLDTVTAIEVTNATFDDIMTSGYTIEEFSWECPALTGDGECRISTRNN